MQAGVAHLEPVGLHRHRLFALEQAHDGVHRFQHAWALRAGIDPQHVSIRRQRTGAAAHHRPAARHVVELDETLRHHQRMMVRQAGHAGAQADVLRPFRGSGDHQFRQGNQFPTGGMVLADPGFVVAKPVEPFQQLHIAGDRQCRVFADTMERGEEDSEFHAATGHGRVLRSVLPHGAPIGPDSQAAPPTQPGTPVAGLGLCRRREETMRLQDKVAIISGAASGMGAATARRFAKEGAKVVIADMLDDEGRQVAADITRANGAAEFMHLDVTDEADWRSVVAATVAKYGRVDILVNNAGISGSAVTDMLDTGAWDRLMSVNARGVFLGTKYAVLEMKQTGGGAIVNLSSISGNTGQTMTHMGYNASKGAVRTLTKSTAVQFGKDGIRANSVHPGLMPPMRTSGATADPAVRAKMLQGVPLRRAGEVDEVANAVLFLASDEASYITGAELYVDGGYLAV